MCVRQYPQRCMQCQHWNIYECKHMKKIADRNMLEFYLNVLSSIAWQLAYFQPGILAVSNTGVEN
jgi:hypothetical protein